MCARARACVRACACVRVAGRMESAALAAADLDPDYVTDGSQVLKRKTTASSGVDEVRILRLHLCLCHFRCPTPPERALCLASA